jgi:peptidoglycan hydrolase CwlO-like protein
MAPSRRSRVLRFVGVVLLASILLPHQAGAKVAGFQAASTSDTPELKQLKAALADANADETKLSNAVKQATGLVNAAERDLAQTGLERLAASTRATQAAQAVAATNNRLQYLQAYLSDRVRSIYVSGSPGDIRALIQSNDPDALLDQVTILDHLAQQGNDSLTDLIVAKKDYAKAVIAERRAVQDARKAEQAIQLKLAKAQQLQQLRQQALQRATFKISQLRGQVAALEFNRRIGDASAAGVVRRGSTKCDSSSASDAEFNIIMKESGWNPLADNPTSTAFGLGQLVFSQRQAYLGANADTTDCGLQLQAFRKYVANRYGTAENAWAFWQTHHWY